MIVTGAFLAEAAAVVDNKLNVSGGALTSYQVGPDRIANVTLVVFIQAEADDKAPKLDIEIVKPFGDSEAVQMDMPEASLGGEHGFAVFPLGLPMEINGRHLLLVTSRGGGFVSIPLRVDS